jgi:hypothetical protein
MSTAATSATTTNGGYATSTAASSSPRLELKHPESRRRPLLRCRELEHGLLRARGRGLTESAITESVITSLEPFAPESAHLFFSCL